MKIAYLERVSENFNSLIVERDELLELLKEKHNRIHHEMIKSRLEEVRKIIAENYRNKQDNEQTKQ